MNFHIVTYATHDSGRFAELINNKFNITVKVIGFGNEWKGFIDKMIAINQYVKTLPEDDVIIFVDGFDTLIYQPLDLIKSRFLEFNKNIVLSNDCYNFGYAITEQSFGKCYDKLIANAGMYAGYCKHINKLLDYILHRNYSDDDQRCLNHACAEFKNDIIIDVKNRLFHNQNYYERYFNNKSDACFVSTPGDLTWERIKRAPGEYLQFFWKDVTIILLLICVIYLTYKYITLIS